MASARNSRDSVCETMSGLAAFLPDGVMTLDTGGVIVGVNLALVAMTGFAESDLIGDRPSLSLWSATNEPRFEGFLAQIQAGDMGEREVTLLRKLGEPFVALVAMSRLEPEIDTAAFVLTLKNITLRNKAETVLRRTQENLRLVMDTIPQRLFWKDRHGRYLGCNRVLAEDAGLNSPAEIVGKTDVELSWKQSASLYRAEDREVVEKGMVKVNYEEMQVRRDGSTVWVRATKVPLRNERAEIIGVFGSYEDITRRKHAEIALRESEEKYRYLVDQGMDGVILTDADGNNLEANPAAHEMLGYARNEFLDLNIRHLIGGENLRGAPLRIPELSSGETVTIDRVLIRKDGTRIPVEMRARQLHDGNVIGFIRDISLRNEAEEKQRALEAQLRQAQKMEALGTLAGGVAHDFNNILLAVRGYAELIQQDLTGADPKHKDLEHLLSATERGRQLIRRILSFSRPDEMETQPVVFSQVVRDAIPLVRDTLPTTIEIRDEFEDCEGCILGDEGSIQQILLNLATNAAHAMREGGGVFDISLRSVRLESGLSHRHGELSAGPYFHMIVSDNGVGIEPDHVDRIFDPFFTTKGVGKGTGLGLSMVHGIIVGMGGAVEVHSTPGQGTRFDLYFPVSDVGGSEVPRSAEKPLVRGVGRILFVDDDPQLAELGTRMLGKQGYDVTAFTDPLEARSAFEADPLAFDAVITDETMPGRTGTALAKDLHEVRSDIPIVLVTGFSEDVTQESAMRNGLSAFLMKPYSYAELSRVVHDALHSAGEGADESLRSD